MKEMENTHKTREKILRNQIEFMKNVLHGVFKECEACKGEGCFEVGEGEFTDVVECEECLGTGIKLCKKNKDVS